MITVKNSTAIPLLDTIEQNIKNHPKLSCAYAHYSSVTKDESLEGMLVDCFKKLQDLSNKIK